MVRRWHSSLENDTDVHLPLGNSVKSDVASFDCKIVVNHMAWFRHSGRRANPDNLSDGATRASQMNLDGLILLGER